MNRKNIILALGIIIAAAAVSFLFTNDEIDTAETKDNEETENLTADEEEEEPTVPEKNKTALSDVSYYGPDNTSGHIEDEHRELMMGILESASIEEEKDGLVLRYKQPEIREGLHLTVEFYVYKQDEKGEDEALFIKNNDSGWLTENTEYDPETHEEKWEAAGVGPAAGKFVLFRIQILEADPEAHSVGRLASYTYTQDYDGSCRLLTQVRYPEGEDYETAFYEQYAVCPAFTWLL